MRGPLPSILATNAGSHKCPSKTVGSGNEKVTHMLVGASFFLPITEIGKIVPESPGRARRFKSDHGLMSKQQALLG